MYTQYHKTIAPKVTVCPECGNNRLQFNYSKITCTNCGHVIKINSFNKYGAKRTVAQDGIKRDSKYEASVADSLLMRKKIGDIKDYDSQYRVEADIYNSQGVVIAHKRHKVDFRIHHNDGTFELYEAKGVITSDYQWRRDIVIEIFLSEHKDHTYTVVKQTNFRNYKKYGTI